MYPSYEVDGLSDSRPAGIFRAVTESISVTSDVDPGFRINAVPGAVEISAFSINKRSLELILLRVFTSPEVSTFPVSLSRESREPTFTLEVKLVLTAVTERSVVAVIEDDVNAVTLAAGVASEVVNDPILIVAVSVISNVVEPIFPSPTSKAITSVDSTLVTLAETPLPKTFGLLLSVVNSAS